ncbi:MULTISPECIES: hypothetical protein [Sphingomonas]|uniref:hypothetical protein n=1 Tax=Sphingomonas TaxID=13687 RepID=UPI000F7EC684|nr:hypothetical protein [Sphingomonas sp. ABOLF]RSV15969.1 hypothetical protein CA235_06395 [Sphingomonas sp. ABOLF]RSV16050.1 hypothetical protein CA235_06870 [Sphingomonas sp. ABOLF]GLK20163.1 hypothetical protein GCM10017606_09890 [Microbacterium terregens]
MSDADLSGVWLGIFNYPEDLPATSFRATLTDTGGRLGGTIEEIDAVILVGRHLTSALDGTRDGRAVRFTKFYAPVSEDYDVVEYRGTVNAEGDEITGHWQVHGAWGGSFIMTRPQAAPAQAEQSDAAER